MIDIGINYITELENPKNRYDDVYKFLITNGYINTLKFPGKHCNYEVLKEMLALLKQTHAKIDIHGLPNMVPSIHSRKFLEEVNWNELAKIIFSNKNITRFSTHMGLENKDKIENYRVQELEKKFSANIEKLKQEMQKILNHRIEVGVENIPGGFEYDLETITPEFISNIWENTDFAVFDITHAKLAAKDLKISYEEYLKRLKQKEKVKILHISGNIDTTNQYQHKPDKHVLINSNEIEDIIKTLKVFYNVDLIVSEYAFKTKYNYEKELIIEAITLHTLVETMKKEPTIKVLEYLEKNVMEDASNIQEIVNSKKWKEENKIWKII